MALDRRRAGQPEEAERWARRALDEVGSDERRLLYLEVALEGACSGAAAPADRFGELAREAGAVGLDLLVTRARREAQDCGVPFVEPSTDG